MNYQYTLRSNVKLKYRFLMLFFIISLINCLAPFNLHVSFYNKFAWGFAAFIFFILARYYNKPFIEKHYLEINDNELSYIEKVYGRSKIVIPISEITKVIKNDALYIHSSKQNYKISSKLFNEVDLGQIERELLAKMKVKEGH